MSGGKRQFLFTIFLILLIFGIGTKIVNAEELEGEDRDQIQEKLEEAILAAGRPNQDNYTAIVMQYHGNGEET